MSFEGILLWSLVIGAAIGAGLLVVALRGAEPSAIARATALGQFVAALEAAESAPPRERDDLLAAAIAAKHRCEWERARSWLEAALRDDPADGEVNVELGLVAAYNRDAVEADERLRAAIAARADLAESITLHRAFAALAGGDRTHAARLFEEVEAPLRNQAHRRRRVGRAGVRRVVPPRRRAVARRRRHRARGVGLAQSERVGARESPARARDRPARWRPIRSADRIAQWIARRALAQCLAQRL